MSVFARLKNAVELAARDRERCKQGGGVETGAWRGNPPAFSVRQKWSYAAIANFIAGVIPPSAMLGRSWLYVHSQR
ncbi:hypothetical protein, partial [Xanthomonas phaseoli]|uniref:hypothetical protein n=1 Tax=Xanthomonas phaseoli TaxID=1985254 RepID=UPI001F219517